MEGHEGAACLMQLVLSSAVPPMWELWGGGGVCVLCWALLVLGEGTQCLCWHVWCWWELLESDGGVTATGAV